APKRLPCHLLFDTSASMTVSSAKRTKYAMALYIAGGLAFACLDRLSPVGLVGIGSGAIRVEPSLSKHQILQWLHRLRRFRYDETTELAQRINELTPSLNDRSLIIVLSDLHDPHMAPSLTQMAQRHDVVVLQFRDPAEVSLRGSGFIRAQEAETGRSFVTHGRRTWLDQDAIDDCLKKAGIDHLVLDTDQPFVHVVRYFFKSRDLLGKGTR
ncbi:MAG: DUF58 domain-containing protein, partial [Planctomycetota bacterium]